MCCWNDEGKGKLRYWRRPRRKFKVLFRSVDGVFYSPVRGDHWKNDELTAPTLRGGFDGSHGIYVFDDADALLAYARATGLNLNMPLDVIVEVEVSGLALVHKGDRVLSPSEYGYDVVPSGARVKHAKVTKVVRPVREPTLAVLAP